MSRKFDLAVAITMLIASAAAYSGGVITTDVKGVHTITAEAKSGGVFVKCRFCDQKAEHLRQAFVSRGYEIVDKADAVVTVIVSGYCSVLKGGKVVNASIDEVFNETLPQVVPPYRDQSTPLKQQSSALDIDGGVVAEGAKLTGSGVAGATIGVAAGALRVITSSDSQSNEAAGKAVVNCRIISAGKKDQYFSVSAVSDSDADPKELVAAAFNKAIAVLVPVEKQ